MKTIKLICLFCLLNGFMSCEPSDLITIILDQHPQDTTFTASVIDSNIVWKYNPGLNRNIFSSMNPVLYGNTVLFSRRTSGLQDGLMFFDKKTGVLLNLFENHTSNEWLSGESYQYQHYCVLTDWYEVFLLDMENKKIQRRFNLKNFGYEARPRISGFGEWIYISVGHNGHPRKNYTNTWLRWNLTTDQMEEILSIEDPGTFEASFESLAFWLKPNGDTVMIFQNRQYDFINKNRRIDLYAFNIRTKEFEWKLDSITKTGNSTIFPILIQDDRLYFQGVNDVYCYSCYDGSLIWERYFPEVGISNANALLEEGNYILQAGENKMIGINSLNGKINWTNHSAGYSLSNLVYHKGYIYYETGKDGLGVLRRIRVSDGKVDWTLFPSAYKQLTNASYGTSGIAIDHETNLLYSNDRVYHLCIKLPK
ncbi:MAG: PQQ-binding-like beta-propeller repeat protein [Saprospiraceae bacterium]|nr:PQQ-binding-like beta-propeller repeat protein [Saprospiraceae bacterium]